jgi:hypothetical protein
VSNDALQYYNGGRYPIPQTAMVVLMEVIKLVATVIRSKGRAPRVPFVCFPIGPASQRPNLNFAPRANLTP